MRTYRDLLHYIKVYRRYLGRRMYLILALTTATAFMQGLGITLLLPLLRTSQKGEGTGQMGMVEQFLTELLTVLGISDSMIGILAFIAVVFVGKGALQFARDGYEGYLQAQLLRELKTRLFDAYSGMEYQYYIRQNAGHFINVINQQVNRFFTSFKNLAKFTTRFVNIFTYFLFAFAITWRFALLALSIGAIFLFLFKYLNEYVRRLSRLESKEMSRLNKLLVQSLQSFKYIVSTNKVESLRGRVFESIKQLTGYIFRKRIARSFTMSLREPMSVLLIVGLILLQITVFDSPIEPIFVSLLLFHRGMQSVIGLQGSWQSMMNRIGSVEMVDEEFDAVLNSQEEGGGRRLDSFNEGISFRDVRFGYNEEKDVLRDVNIEIPANKTVALVGESGAGKSTLMDMLTLVLRPRMGEIRIDGIPHAEVDPASWRNQIGYVSQETVIFDDTVANNISLWAGDIEEDAALHDRVVDAAERAHADHFIRELPDGYQTMVGDRGIRLSGGQRQRVSIARELFKDPDLLLLDEATSDLDTASEQRIQDSIDALHGRVTVVIIAHRLSTVKNADRVCVIDDGRVIEEGSYGDLRSRREGEFRKMLEMQSV